MSRMRRALFAVAVVALLGPPSGCSGDSEATDASILRTVERGDLEISVREQGEIRAAHEEIIKNQVEGYPRLTYIIDEGTVVKKGEKLAEVDISEVEERRATQAIRVAKAEAAHEQAKKNWAILEKELVAAEKTALSKWEIAKLRVEKFIGQRRRFAEGEGDPILGTNAEMIAKLRELIDPADEKDVIKPLQGSRLVDEVLEFLGDEENLELEMGELANQVLKLVDEISLARADLALATDTLMHSRRLIKKGYITRNKLERDEIDFQRRTSAVTVACNNLQLLVKYTLPETKITLEQDVQNTKLAHDSVIGKNDARRVREKAELTSAGHELKLATERLENYDEQIANAVMVAPIAGQVIYRSNRWRTRVRLGMDLGRGQSIIALPDVSKMIVKLKVHEAQVSKVAKGQTVVLRMDAFPGEDFLGTITAVSSLPDSNSRWNNQSLKVYAVEAELDRDNSDGELRPGMSASVEIKVGVRKNVLNIPSAAVVHRGDDKFVWREIDGEAVAVRVELGDNNLTHVEVLAGLSEGDSYYLVPPPGARLPEVEKTDESDREGGGVGSGEANGDRRASTPDR